VKHFRNGSAANPLTWQNKKHSHWLVLPGSGFGIRGTLRLSPLRHTPSQAVLLEDWLWVIKLSNIYTTFSTNFPKRWRVKDQTGWINRSCRIFPECVCLGFCVGRIWFSIRLNIGCAVGLSMPDSFNLGVWQLSPLLTVDKQSANFSISKWLGLGLGMGMGLELTPPTLSFPCLWLGVASGN